MVRWHGNCRIQEHRSIFATRSPFPTKGKRLLSTAVSWKDTQITVLVLCTTHRRLPLRRPVVSMRQLFWRDVHRLWLTHGARQTETLCLSRNLQASGKCFGRLSRKTCLQHALRISARRA